MTKKEILKECEKEKRYTINTLNHYLPQLEKNSFIRSEFDKREKIYMLTK